VNIIGNAVKFTPEHGKVKVRARFVPEQSNKEISSYLKNKDLSADFIEDNEDKNEFQEKLLNDGI
jgi:signal transduction histidine kinase